MLEFNISSISSNASSLLIPDSDGYFVRSIARTSVTILSTLLTSCYRYSIPLHVEDSSFSPLFCFICLTFTESHNLVQTEIRQTWYHIGLSLHSLFNIVIFPYCPQVFPILIKPDISNLPSIILVNAFSWLESG